MWKMYSLAKWEHGNVLGNMFVEPCAVGDLWIRKQGIAIILASMLASITCIMSTSYIHIQY